LEQRTEQVRATTDFYLANNLTIAIVAEQLGRDAFETIGYLAQSGAGIKCCIGTPEEQKAAILSLAEADEIVFDITSLATLRLLQAINLLEQLPGKVIIGQATIGLLEEKLYFASLEKGTKGGTVLLNQGSLAYDEITKEERQGHCQSLRTFINELRSNARIVGCKQVSEIEPVRRTNLQRIFGEHGLEAIVLSSSGNRVLVTDDIAVGVIAQNEFGAKRAWTQMLMYSLAQQGTMEVDTFNSATAKLLGYKYSFTFSSADSLVAAARQAEWDPARWPLSPALTILELPTVDLTQSFLLLISFCNAIGRIKDLDPTLIRMAAFSVFSLRPGSMELLRAALENKDIILGQNDGLSPTVFSDLKVWITGR
jgi:hypothetical protein